MRSLALARRRALPFRARKESLTQERRLLRQHGFESIKAGGRQRDLAIMVDGGIEDQRFLGPYQANGIRVRVRALGKQSHIGGPIEPQKDSLPSEVRISRGVASPVAPGRFGDELRRACA